MGASPLGGFANRHLESMNSLHQGPTSEGLDTIADSTSLKMWAQESLTALGTCWRVGTLRDKTESRSGRASIGDGPAGGRAGAWTALEEATSTGAAEAKR